MWTRRSDALAILTLSNMIMATALAAPLARAADKIGAKELSAIVHKQLATRATPSTSTPNYLIGDFNGDGHQDIAIEVVIEEGRDEIKRNGVRFVSANPYSEKNGRELDTKLDEDMGHNCYGLFFVHGTSAGLGADSPAGKYLIYDCFSSFKLHPKSRPVPRGSGSRGPTPKPKGDSIVLDLETGGASLVYWNGTTYRGFGIRMGD